METVSSLYINGGCLRLVSTFGKRPVKIEKNPAHKPARKPRSDGERNRQLIVQAAKEAFTQNGSGASLDDIAKKAGVGPGTLYRHFPSREALLEAVYKAEVEHLAEAAEQLSQELPPIEALRAWLQLFIEHLATKKVIAAALNSLVSNTQVFEAHMPKVRLAVASIYDRAIKAGEIRADINPVDHLRAILGATFFGTGDDWQESAIRLVDIRISRIAPDYP